MVRIGRRSVPRRTGTWAALAVATALLPAACAPGTAVPSPPLAITHVTLIDGTGSAARADVTVIVVGRRLSAVGAAGSVAVRAGARVVDGRGRYLIPGLWDMHARPFVYDFPRGEVAPVEQSIYCSRRGQVASRR